MDVFEGRVRFLENTPAIYGGMGSFYSATVSELKSGAPLYLKVAVPFNGNKQESIRLAAEAFRDKIFLRSKDQNRADIPLTFIETVPWSFHNGVEEHPDNSQMEDIAMHGQKRLFVKMAFRISHAAFLDDIKEREFFDIIQPGREGEKLLLSNADDKEFKVDHAADTHVRLRDYRAAIDFVKKIMARIDYLYDRRAVTADQASHWKQGWLDYVKNLEVNYAENVKSWLNWEKKRYKSGEIDFVVIHGDEIDNVNDADSLAQLPFSGENTRLLAYLLDQAGIPVMVETGNHARHRPNFFQTHHPPHVNVNPAGSATAQAHEKDYYSRIIEADKGYGTLDYMGGILRELTPKAAGEPQVVPGHGWWASTKTFFGNFGYAVRELLIAHLFDALPTRQTTDDQFRANQYLYINSEPNLALKYKGHTFLMTDTGAEDFRFVRYLLSLTGYSDSALVYLAVPFMPGLWNQVATYIGEKEVPAKGYPDSAITFFIQKAFEAHEKKSSEITFSSHFPWFHYLKRVFLDNYSSNTVNPLSRRAMLLYFWFFKPVLGTVISGHIHNWEGFAYDLNLDEEKKKELLKQLKDLFVSRLGPIGPKACEDFQKEMGQLWEKYKLDDHLVIPAEVDKSHGGDFQAILKAHQKEPEKFRPLFVTLEAIGPTNALQPAGILTETIRDGKTTELTATSLFFNRDGSVTARPLAEEEKEHKRRQEEAIKTYPPRPPEPPVNLDDPYEGIF